MQYLALTVVTLVGGAGSFVSLDSGNPMFAVIFAVIAVAGFAAGCPMSRVIAGETDSKRQQCAQRPSSLQPTEAKIVVGETTPTI
jgi:hypothetical protein